MLVRLMDGGQPLVRRQLWPYPGTPGIAASRLSEQIVFWGVWPWGRAEGRAVKDRGKLSLVRALYVQARPGEVGSPVFALEHDSLGKPRLSVDGREAGFVSFTHQFASTWAAFCREVPVGIDIAGKQEFAGAYPFDRAFHPDEGLGSLASGLGVGEAAALLWSVKEAAVKAAGTGFHLIDPRDARVRILALDGNRALAAVRPRWTDGRFPSSCVRDLAVRSFRLGPGWMSLALALWPATERIQT